VSGKALSRLLVAAASVAVFAPALTAGFAGWDDPVFVAGNPLIRGLSPAHLREMLTSTLGGVRMPLAWLSLALDHALWGLEPGGYHLTSLLLHALTALLFHELCRALFGRLGLKEAERGALLAALLYAVHPLRVESVAWIYERKGVLSGALWTAALLARLKKHDAERPGRWEAAALACYALSLAAKPNGLTFPLVLLVVERALLGLRPAWTGYLPYFALSAAAFFATLSAGAQEGAVSSATLDSLPWRTGQALYGLWFYILQTLSPQKLSVYYPPKPWFPDWSWWHAFLAAALAGAAFFLRWAGPRARPWALALACYALALLPMLGLVQHGVPHAAADRFSYLAGMALAAPLGAWLASQGWKGSWAAMCLALGLGISSWQRSHDWKTPLSLWSSAARARPSAFALANEGALLLSEGRHEEAVDALRASLMRGKHDALPHENLGRALSALGRKDEAREAYAAALALDPRRGAALNDLALLELERGSKARARELFARALELPETRPVAAYNLGRHALVQRRATRPRPSAASARPRAWTPPSARRA
jgi:protein O-mannosyl-transferase